MKDFPLAKSEELSIKIIAILNKTVIHESLQYIYKICQLEHKGDLFLTTEC